MATMEVIDVANAAPSATKRWQANPIPDVQPAAFRRFIAKVDFSTGKCWQWAGLVSEKGYGLFDIKLKRYRAHRVAWVWFVGPIDDRLQLDHLCANKGCVNPDHLEPVLPQVNQERAMKRYASLRTHCAQGHPYDVENTGWSRGCRRCKACQRASTARRAARRKAASA